MSGESFVFFFVNFLRDDFRNLAKLFFLHNVSLSLSVEKVTLIGHNDDAGEGTQPSFCDFEFCLFVKQTVAKISHQFARPEKGNRNEGPWRLIFKTRFEPSATVALVSQPNLGFSSVAAGPGGV